MELLNMCSPPECKHNYFIHYLELLLIHLCPHLKHLFNTKRAFLLLVYLQAHERNEKNHESTHFDALRTNILFHVSTLSGRWAVMAVLWRRPLWPGCMFRTCSQSHSGLERSSGEFTEPADIPPTLDRIGRRHFFIWMTKMEGDAARWTEPPLYPFGF